MKLGPTVLLSTLIASAQVYAQAGSMSLPKTVTAGDSFSIPTSGSGTATLHILGLGQVLKRDVQLGQTVYISTGTLYSAGRYIAVLSSGDSATDGQFDVVPSSKPAEITFLARPSRLPVSQHEGITGAAYVLDAYHNLIVTPMSISFALSPPAGAEQNRTVTTRDGAAWTAFDSTPQQGTDKFAARAGDISSTRIIRQVPGDPCGLRMTAQHSGKQVEVKTDPVRDCSGNAVPDGTIVTFTEAFDSGQSTVDVPLKRGFAQVDMPFRPGATISVASGVALGNQIRLEK